MDGRAQARFRPITRITSVRPQNQPLIIILTLLISKTEHRLIQFIKGLTQAQAQAQDFNPRTWILEPTQSHYGARTVSEELTLHGPQSVSCRHLTLRIKVQDTPEWAAVQAKWVKMSKGTNFQL